MHIDSRIAAVGLEDDAQLIQGFEQVDAGHRVGTLAVLELDRGNAGERFDQRSQRLKIPIGPERTGADQVLIDHGDGAADVADLVRNRAHQDARAGQQLLQAGFLAFPQLLGSIHDEGGQARAHGRLVGGKEHISQKHVAARALAAALHLGAERRLRRAADRHAAERRHIAPDAPTGKFAVGHAEQPVRGLVGPQDQAIGCHGQDGHGAAFDQKFELLFGGTPRGHFAFHAVQVIQFARPAAADFEGEQPGAGQCDEHQEVLRQRQAERKMRRKDVRKQRTQRRRGQNPPAGPHGAYQQNGAEIQEAERQRRIDLPVNQGHSQDEQGGRGHTEVALKLRQSHW